MNKQIPFREAVAEEMIKHLEAGTAPWQKPWKAGVIQSRPFNPTTGKPYKGINSFWLELAGHSDPRWMTFNQAKTLGASVQKGSKATRIEYWQWHEEKPILNEDGKPALDENGLKKTRRVRLDRPRVFHAAVFNAEQIDGLAPYKAPEPDWDLNRKAEEVLAGSGVLILNDQSDQAYYQRGTDRIHIPAKAAFKEAYEYYATALHEVGHATGAEHRMIREKGPFGSELYAKEELMVEMASYRVSQELGLGHYPDRHASYVESWLSAIKEDRNFLFQAAAVSEKIRTWVMEPEQRKALEQQTQQAFINSKADLNAHLTAGPHQEEQMTESKKRIYLAVPFDEKDEAKALGAKWDRKAKAWYARANVEIASVEKWISKEPAPVKGATDPATEFTDFLKTHGATLKGSVILDGKWHRASLEGETKKQNVSYRVFMDGHPNGQIHNFKTGETHQWVASGTQLSPEEKAALLAKAATKKLERDLEIQEIRRTAAKRSYGIWMNTPAWANDQNSAYLKKKQVRGYGIKVNDKGEVIIPLRDTDGRIHSLQTIGKSGKRFMEGGHKEGLFHVIDPANKLRTKADTILIAEGYSTGATVHAATKQPVIVAFDSGNLKSVAQNIRIAHPEAKIVFMADNDYPLLEKQPFKNVGLEKAKEAARDVGGTVMTPVFNDKEKEKGLTDWNDVSLERGPKVISALLRRDLNKALRSEKAKDHSLEMSL
ncbi:MAG: zincin-like metallopeptidase domain-containing protein [Sneathiella sp.]